MHCIARAAYKNFKVILQYVKYTTHVVAVYTKVQDATVGHRRQVKH